MTDQYEPKGPFRAEYDFLVDGAGWEIKFSYMLEKPAGDSFIFCSMDPKAFAARIADALNAQERVKELEAFVETVDEISARLMLANSRCKEDALDGAVAELISLCNQLRQARALKSDEGDQQ